MSDGRDEHDPFEPEIYIGPEHLAGVWANSVRVALSQHEFTLDFERLDYRDGTPPREGILVARVACSSALVADLLDLLEREFSRYTRSRLPEEVRGDGEVDVPEEG